MKGLIWAWKKGERKVMIQSDSHDAVEGVNGQITFQGPAHNMVEACQSWMRKQWEVCIVHVYREQNMVADAIVKMTVAEDTQWLELRVPLGNARCALEEDNVGRSWSRHIYERDRA